MAGTKAYRLGPWKGGSFGKMPSLLPGIATKLSGFPVQPDGWQGVPTGQTQYDFPSKTFPIAQYDTVPTALYRFKLVRAGDIEEFVPQANDFLYVLENDVGIFERLVLYNHTTLRRFLIAPKAPGAPNMHITPMASEVVNRRFWTTRFIDYTGRSPNVITLVKYRPWGGLEVEAASPYLGAFWGNSVSFPVRYPTNSMIGFQDAHVAYNYRTAKIYIYDRKTRKLDAYNAPVSVGALASSQRKYSLAKENENEQYYLGNSGTSSYALFFGKSSTRPYYIDLYYVEIPSGNISTVLATVDAGALVNDIRYLWVSPVPTSVTPFDPSTNHWSATYRALVFGDDGHGNPVAKWGNISVSVDWDNDLGGYTNWSLTLGTFTDVAMPTQITLSPVYHTVIWPHATNGEADGNFVVDLGAGRLQKSSEMSATATYTELNVETTYDEAMAGTLIDVLIGKDFAVYAFENMLYVEKPDNTYDWVFIGVKQKPGQQLIEWANHKIFVNTSAGQLVAIDLEDDNIVPIGMSKTIGFRNDSGAMGTEDGFYMAEDEDGGIYGPTAKVKVNDPASNPTFVGPHVSVVGPWWKQIIVGMKNSVTGEYEHVGSMVLEDGAIYGVKTAYIYSYAEEGTYTQLSRYGEWPPGIGLPGGDCLGEWSGRIVVLGVDSEDKCVISDSMPTRTKSSWWFKLPSVRQSSFIVNHRILDAIGTIGSLYVLTDHGLFEVSGKPPIWGTNNLEDVLGWAIAQKSFIGGMGPLAFLKGTLMYPTRVGVCMVGSNGGIVSHVFDDIWPLDNNAIQYFRKTRIEDEWVGLHVKDQNGDWWLLLFNETSHLPIAINIDACPLVYKADVIGIGGSKSSAPATDRYLSILRDKTPQRGYLDFSGTKQLDLWTEMLDPGQDFAVLELKGLKVNGFDISGTGTYDIVVDVHDADDITTPVASVYVEEFGKYYTVKNQVRSRKFIFRIRTQDDIAIYNLVAFYEPVKR